MSDKELLLEFSEMLDKKLAPFENKLEVIDKKVTDIDKRVTDIDKRVTDIDKRVTDIDNKVTNMELILENEIRVNIQRVAEGHLDLSRNLHNAIKTNNEIEMLAIKVNVLESEVKTLKLKIS